MSKFVHDDVLDLLLAGLAAATRLVVCSGQPANFAGIAAVALADVVIDGGDFTTSNGDTSGRKVRVGAQSAVTIDNSGTATHVSIDDGAKLLGVTTCPSQVLTAAGTVDVPVHDYEVSDPT